MHYSVVEAPELANPDRRDFALGGNLEHGLLDAAPGVGSSMHSLMRNRADADAFADRAAGAGYLNNRGQHRLLDAALIPAAVRFESFRIHKSEEI